jgi:hypothetical protein
MEAITIAGLVVLAVGGYYSVVDFLNDLGLCGRRFETATQKPPVSQRYIITPQTGIKKVAGMHI